MKGLTTRYYDEENRLIEERTVTSEESIREVYEYDPDGDLYHIRTEINKLQYHKYYAQLPGGTYDTSRLLEKVEMAPTGEVCDQWFSWEHNGQVKKTELVIRTANGDMANYVFYN
jgi:hypothetical protein